jgi:hypothetical protein
VLIAGYFRLELELVEWLTVRNPAAENLAAPKLPLHKPTQSLVLRDIVIKTIKRMSEGFFMRAHIRAMQTVSIVVLIIAASAALTASAFASERHSDEREHRHDSVSYEYPHHHAAREKYEHPPLHSEGTRADEERPSQYEDPDDYLERQRLRELSDEPYENE